MEELSSVELTSSTSSVVLAAVEKSLCSDDAFDLDWYFEIEGREWWLTILDEKAEDDFIVNDAIIFMAKVNEAAIVKFIFVNDIVGLLKLKSDC